MHMTVAYPLLGILNQQPSYGYELKKRYDTIFNKEKGLAIGYLYSTLSRLARDNKISEVAIADQSGGPERKQYAITATGKEELVAWLSMPERLHQDTQTVLYTKVVTAILVDQDPNVYLDAQRVAHLARMHELTEMRSSGDLSQALRADYDLFHLEADLRWIDVTSARLATLTKEVRGE